MKKNISFVKDIPVCKFLHVVLFSFIFSLVASRLRGIRSRPLRGLRLNFATLVLAGSLSFFHFFIVTGGCAAFAAERNVAASIDAAQTRAAVTSENIGAGRVASRVQNAAARTRSPLADTARTTINSNPAVRRAGVTLRPTAVDAIVRPTIAGTDSYIGSTFNPGGGRNVTTRGRAATDVALAANTATLDANESCRVQYMDCMDQFCNVVDANQKRCSCSGRLANYQRVQDTVTEANNQLNEVAQMIRYVGLTADEIRSIMTATEAELELDNQTDTTDARDQLTAIENLIRDPSAPVTTTNSSLGFLDMDLDFSAEADSWLDMFSLDGGNQQSFSQMRGSRLYSAAAARCKIVLTNCQRAGANTATATARYDMEIDKDCIAYEQGLNKMNQTLRTNVRAATSMLQKARLEVLNSQNSLDARGCMAALDTCMADDMVCGKNYTKCLDPTKRYIDENGGVVLGENISRVIDFTSAYDASAVDINSAGCSGDGLTNGNCIVAYLLDKIGTDTKTGLCRAVMDKCRRVTYDDAGNYIQNNIVLENYISRAMVNIRAGAAKIVSDYASSCISEIATCYSAQVTQVSAWSTSASPSSIQSVMNGACRNVALTCAYAVFDNDVEDRCPVDADTDRNSPENENICIKNISEMFYQSMLCPDGSEYRADETGAAGAWNPDNTRIWVNNKCLCPTGQGAASGRCVTCPSNSIFMQGSLHVIDGVSGCMCNNSDGYFINGNPEILTNAATYGSCRQVTGG